MTTEETIKKLKEMKLPAFADGFRSMLQDPETGKLEYPDVIGMLVDLEYDNRKSNSLTKLIKKADFEIKGTESIVTIFPSQFAQIG